MQRKARSGKARWTADDDTIKVKIAVDDRLQRRRGDTHATDLRIRSERRAKTRKRRGNQKDHPIQGIQTGEKRRRSRRFERKACRV
eukprot:2986328-Pleurochrysis_carterae.AAC.1